MIMPKFVAFLSDPLIPLQKINQAIFYQAVKNYFICNTYIRNTIDITQANKFKRLQTF